VAKSLQLKIALVLHLLLTWSAFAYAAEENSFVAGMESIPLKAIGLVFFISVVGGSASTLTKIARPDVVIRSLVLEIAKDFVCSITAGLLVFLFTSWWTWNFWGQATMILLAGYGGSKVLDFGLAEGFFPALSRALGRSPMPPPVVVPPVTPPTEETPQ
jgi:hypothetical protein